MSKPWGKIGAWAADAEQAEAEEREAQREARNFPSLKEAVTVSAKPKVKKKMSLMEFTAATEYSSSTPDEMRRLPTGPKERSSDEMQFNRLGGGFSSYGGGARSGPPPRDNDGSWGGGGRRSYGGFDEERRGGPPPSRVSDFDQPSRADEVDNWASVKKSLPVFDSGRQNRYGSGSLGGGSGSRADGVDNWGLGKKPIPARSSTFGSGFRDSGSEPDRWTRFERDSDRERPRLELDPPRGEVSVVVKPNPFGAARPREEVLADKGLDWKKVESEIETKKTSRPSSSHSSRPSSAQSSHSEGAPETVVKARPKVNPFGDAKPREVLLEERGKDWRKIDLELEHRRVDRPETVEEKLLKEEIDNLKKEIEKDSTTNSNKESMDETGGDQTSTRAMLLQKERELEILIRDLDDKVRFGQKAIERPGSAAGKTTGFPDRPPSESGSFEDSRRVEFADRPRSRGAGDTWMRPGDDKRPSQGSRDRRGFLSSRDMNRSRERW
ncbi:eukaryotic translation initiation factor 4B2-like isoform X2 [Gastrolobium bilobum]|uniref:eukaryotic translation initiation factor 4B2-like isoform X2 n=1 Tax=Gastrolobium bilobum TaxID=150636 RepID=UPI002AB1C56E|nr:eukaryotic translation initiation factor 4B2-like isoform X2 [Gastrolobium bilobum]